jgi:hypothetical protein
MVVTLAFAAVFPIGAYALFSDTGLFGLMLVFGTVVPLPFVAAVYRRFSVKWNNSTHFVAFGEHVVGERNV